jgi:low affinity Fe/Cu permease
MSTAKQDRSGWWRRYRVAPRVEQRTVGSRWLYRVDHYSSLPVVAGAVGALLVSAVIVGGILGFPDGWIVAFESTTSAVTLAMVFVIQHTQSREQAATQRKLDELLRALPEARTGLIMLEEASEETMKRVEEGQRDLKRQTARDDHPRARDVVVGRG